MAIVVTTLTGTPTGTGKQPWALAFTSADASGGETVLAAATGKCHYIERVAIICDCIGTVTLRQAATTLMGPIPFAVQKTAAGMSNAVPFVFTFRRAIRLTTATAITVISSAAGNLFGIVEGYSI